MRGNIAAATGVIMTLIFLVGLLFAGGIMQAYLNKTATDLNVTIDSGWQTGMQTAASGAGTITNIFVAAAVIVILIGAIVGIFAARRK